MEIRELTMVDYPSLVELLQTTPGVSLREADSREATASYLLRNPGLSFVAEENLQIVGCVMCGHDGRRGYLQHLIVKPSSRKQGIGRALVDRCISALQKRGILKTHIHVFKSNKTGNAFWVNAGWNLRDDVSLYSFNTSSNPNV